MDGSRRRQAAALAPGTGRKRKTARQDPASSGWPAGRLCESTRIPGPAQVERQAGKKKQAVFGTVGFVPCANAGRFFQAGRVRSEMIESLQTSFRFGL